MFETQWKNKWSILNIMVQPYVRICAGFNKYNISVSSDLMKFGWLMFVI